MKEEELIKKLEEVKLPEIELASHRRRLRMALVDAGYHEKRQEVTFMQLAKARVKGGADMILSGLAARRPVWKTALISAFAVLLIAALALALPSLTGQPSEALAADIAQSSPEVIAALGGDEVERVKVMNIKGDLATVIVEGEMGGIVTALVDLHTRAVTEVIEGPQLTDEEKENALNIVTADPRVQELLDKGAVIDMVLPLYVHFSGINQETGEIEEIVETWAQVWIELGNQHWGAQVDLIRGRVVALTD